jgi:hypothetical protein
MLYLKYLILMELKAMKEELEVCFRKDKRGKFKGDITAVFPNDVCDPKGNVTCYAYIGQHSGCSLEWVKEDTIPANEEESAKMKNHLESLVGYEDIELVEVKFNK